MTCPIDKEDVGTFLGSLSSSANPLNRNDEDKYSIRSIRLFSFEKITDSIEVNEESKER